MVCAGSVHCATSVKGSRIERFGKRTLSRVIWHERRLLKPAVHLCSRLDVSFIPPDRGIEEMFKKLLTAVDHFEKVPSHTEQNSNKTMRTKTLLLIAAVAVAGVVASNAQVYSVNAVGYVNKSIPAKGFA